MARKKPKNPVMKIGTMNDYAIRLVGASLGSGARRGGGSLIAAAKGASAVRKNLKGPK